MQSKAKQRKVMQCKAKLCQAEPPEQSKAIQSKALPFVSLNQAPESVTCDTFYFALKESFAWPF